MTAIPDVNRPRFSAVLRPHRSLGPRGFAVLMGLTCIVSFGAGIAFLMMGAWPVFGFFGLDALLIYLAFRASYASARVYETVSITDGELVVRHFEAGQEPREWRFPSYWVRVELEGDEDACGPLYLRSHGRLLRVGDFLGPRERWSFAAALRSALASA